MGADQARRQRGAERDLPASRGRQPRMRKRPVQDAAGGGGLAARAARMSGVAIVGTGMWTPRLAGAAERAGLELVACFSRDEQRRAEFAERFGCEPAASFKDAIERPGVEGVLLATPNDVHEEQALA